MTTGLLALARRDPQFAAAAVILVVGGLIICGFFFFQYVVHLTPCPLCFEERQPYYIGVPLAALLLVGSRYGASHKVLFLGFAAVALLMLWDCSLSTYHSGVEWKWWPGPKDCSGPITTLGKAGDLLSRLDKISVVRCDVVQWRFLGLSLSGWNVLNSLFLAATATWGAVASFKRFRSQ